MEDAADSKSADGNIVGVRLPPPAPTPSLRPILRHRPGVWPAETAKGGFPMTDPHSFADLDQGVTQSIALELNVDFVRQKISGTVRLHLAEPGSGAFDLDTRALEIAECRSGGGDAIPFELGDADPILGTRLRLQLPPGTQDIEISCATTEGATALDWLAPEQTAGGTLPYLYSQCQPHHARSIFPCQDTPRVRFTYEARVTVPEALTVVMAAAPGGAEPGSEPGTRTYRFTMPQPIPSYLTALAVGSIASEDLSDRVRIYAEPEVLDRAAWEFASVGDMVGVAESIFGPYEWERYDMLMMPFSFPYGGMENPRLTFLTPTLLAGDRSLVNVVAHELAHSWTGNLVTNATMEDFWINEGFTVWAERRILEALEGSEAAALHAAIGRIALDEAFERFGSDSPYTQLKTPLDGVDPDEVYSEVPYEKGFLFVTLLERTVGRKQWDAVIKRYIGQFRFTSITTEELLEFLDRELPGVLDTVQARRWVYEPGLPANAPVFVSRRLENVKALAQAWARGKRPSAGDVSGWKAEEWQLYLKWLPREISTEDCAELDRRFGLTSSGNYEILVNWLVLAIRSGYAPVLDRVRGVLTTVGRMKYLRPLYQSLLARPEFQGFARDVFDEMRARYHTLSRVTIEGLFEKAGV